MKLTSSLSRSLTLPLFCVVLPILSGAEEPEPTFANVSYGDHELQVVDFWKADREGQRPLHIYIHGGGWVGGDKTTIKNVQKYLDKGISVAAVNYRLSGDHPLPVPVHDAA